MVKLFDAATNAPCGSLSDEQFKALSDALEEEGLEDRDYYINRETIEMLEEQGADPQLVETLRSAIGDRAEMDIRWERINK